MLRSATKSKTHQDSVKTQSSHHRIQSTTQGKPQSRRAQDTIKTQVRDTIKTDSTHKRIIISFKARNKAKHIQDTIKTQVKDTSQRHDQGIVYKARKKKNAARHNLNIIGYKSRHNQDIIKYKEGPKARHDQDMIKTQTRHHRLQSVIPK